MKENTIYTMPAEWESHERTLIAWPVKASMVWPDNYAEVTAGYAQVIKAISLFETVTVLVNEGEAEDVAALCQGKCDIMTLPHNDAWARDNGPTFVWTEDHEILGISWKFNAWGEKYIPYDLDDAVARGVLAKLDVPCREVGIVLEGGSIHVDGQGTLLSTEECLLNPNRNPHLTKEMIEKNVREHLNISQIIWLKRGLFGDETDGHIDNIACFAKPGTVLIQTCDDPEDPNYEITQENLEILRNTKDALGRTLEIIEIPQPPVRYYEDVRLTLSYLNFYIVNGGIILPVFGDDATETDEIATRILQKVFPDRQIVQVDGMALIKEGGNVHCITQQMPLGKRKSYKGDSHK